MRIGRGNVLSMIEGLDFVAVTNPARADFIWLAGLDEHNANPTSTDYDRATFKPIALADPPKTATVAVEDIHHWSAFVPKHSTFFSTYFMITGLHGLHVLGGVLVFAFLWGPGAALYKKNPEHLANRVEVAGLFWHFVDLIWIFVFPLFYLL